MWTISHLIDQVNNLHPKIKLQIQAVRPTFYLLKTKFSGLKPAMAVSLLARFIRSKLKIKTKCLNQFFSKMRKLFENFLLSFESQLGFHLVYYSTHCKNYLWKLILRRKWKKKKKEKL